MYIVTDTHPWVWFLTANTRLAPITLDIHDAILVGTTIHLTAELGQPVSLVTVDKAITESNLVPVIW